MTRNPPTFKAPTLPTPPELGLFLGIGLFFCIQFPYLALSFTKDTMTIFRRDMRVQYCSVDTFNDKMIKKKIYVKII